MATIAVAASSVSAAATGGAAAAGAGGLSSSPKAASSSASASTTATASATNQAMPSTSLMDVLVHHYKQFQRLRTSRMLVLGVFAQPNGPAFLERMHQHWVETFAARPSPIHVTGGLFLINGCTFASMLEGPTAVLLDVLRQLRECGIQAPSPNANESGYSSSSSSVSSSSSAAPAASSSSSSSQGATSSGSSSGAAAGSSSVSSSSSAASTASAAAASSGATAASGSPLFHYVRVLTFIEEVPRMYPYFLSRTLRQAPEEWSAPTTADALVSVSFQTVRGMVEIGREMFAMCMEDGSEEKAREWALTNTSKAFLGRVPCEEHIRGFMHCEDVAEIDDLLDINQGPLDQPLDSDLVWPCITFLKF